MSPNNLWNKLANDKSSEFGGIIDMVGMSGFEMLRDRVMKGAYIFGLHAWKMCANIAKVIYQTKIWVKVFMLSICMLL